MILSMTSSSGSKKPFYIILILLLLIINVVLFVNTHRLKKDRKNMSVAMEQLEAQKTQVQKEYNETLIELENLQAESVEMDSTLIAMQESIEGQKDRIDRMLRKGNISKKELEEARSMITFLQSSTENYKRQIEQLQLANQQLSDENIVLRETVDLERMQKEEVTADRDGLQAETTTLKEEKSALEQQVMLASILETENFSALGIKLKDSGKEVETNNYKKVDKIRVCFDVMPNKVAEAGTKDLYLRIVGPEGATLSVQSMGSGTFMVNGEEKQYTTRALIDYNQDRENFCIYWSQNAQFAKGLYAAELYQYGYMIGSNTFELKKKLF